MVQAVKKIGPAIVNISAEKRLANPFYSDPWGQFFRDFFEGGRQQPRVENSLGSGVIVDPGLHPHQQPRGRRGPSRMRSRSSTRRVRPRSSARIQDADLAVIKIQTKEPLPVIPLATPTT